MDKENNNLCKLINGIKMMLLTFGYAVVDETWNGTVLSPSYSRLYYIIDGKANITLPSGEITTLIPGKWYLLPNGCSFDFNCEHNLEHIYFHLKISSFSGIDLLQNCKKPVFIDYPQFNHLELIKYLDCYDTLSGIYVHQFVEKLIFLILDKNKILLEVKEFSPCVSNAIKYINNNLSLQLSLSEILTDTFVSKSTLTKHFKKELGISVHEYIFDKIMFEVEQLLLQTKMSIGEISDKYKFYDQFYFSRIFKKRYGISPSEYRKIKIM